MLAITCTEFGSPDVLVPTDLPVPVPAAHEVLIKVAAAGVNHADLLQRRGKYPPPMGASPLLGLEVAGEIVAIGDAVTEWKVGARVCALMAGGGYAAYATAPAVQCLPIPEQVSMIDAAALPEAVFTVWANLFEQGGLQPGESVMIHGGASGVGSTAIQMAKAQGAIVLTTSSSDAKAEQCRKLGADFAYNHKTQDYVTEALAATNGRGVTIVLDMYGGDYINKNLKLLATYGSHISIAAPAGVWANIDLRLIMQRRINLTGSTLRSRTIEEKGWLAQALAPKLELWLAEKKLKPLIHKVVPLKNAAEAHKMMEIGGHMGKIILEVED